MVEPWDNDMIQLEITQLLQQRCIPFIFNKCTCGILVLSPFISFFALKTSSWSLYIFCEWIQPSLHENGWCLRSRTIWPWPSSAPVANAPCASTAMASQSTAGSVPLTHPVVLHPGAVRSATLRCPERLGWFLVGELLSSVRIFSSWFLVGEWWLFPSHGIFVSGFNLGANIFHEKTHDFSD